MQCSTTGRTATYVLLRGEDTLIHLMTPADCSLEQHNPDTEQKANVMTDLIGDYDEATLPPKTASPGRTPLGIYLVPRRLLVALLQRRHNASNVLVATINMHHLPLCELVSSEEMK